MTPTERAVAVLNRWCGTDGADQLDEKLEDLWNRTKPIGKPSHSAIPFYQQAAEDLIDSLIAEFKKPDAYRVNISFGNLNPNGGTILTLDNLLNAVSRFRPAKPSMVAVSLTAQAHEALVQSIVTQITPMLAASGRSGVTGSPKKAKATKAPKAVSPPKKASRRRANKKGPGGGQ